MRNPSTLPQNATPGPEWVTRYEVRCTHLLPHPMHPPKNQQRMFIWPGRDDNIWSPHRSRFVNDIVIYFFGGVGLPLYIDCYNGRIPSHPWNISRLFSSSERYWLGPRTCNGGGPTSRCFRLTRWVAWFPVSLAHHFWWAPKKFPQARDAEHYKMLFAHCKCLFCFRQQPRFIVCWQVCWRWVICSPWLEVCGAVLSS